jgi:2-iminobutanoate/2-iminopropanoate deaminase
MIYINNTPNCPNAVGTYSQGVKHNGVFYFSGQIGINPETSKMPSDFESQLEQVLNNINALLVNQNLTKKNIIKTTIFLANLNDFSKVNTAYEKYFEQPYPARSCIEAAKLPKDSLVEIEVIAAE